MSSCKNAVLIIVLVALTVISGAKQAWCATDLMDPAWESRIREGIFKIADTDFEEGLTIFQEYIDSHRKAPEGYFFYAVGVQEKIQKYNDLTELSRYRKYSTKLSDICKRRLVKNKKDSVARMYLGAIHGYTGLLDAKQRNLISAFRQAIKARDNLEQVAKERPDIPDTYFGLGMVYYFASRKSREEGGILGWIITKFITKGKDMRKEGISLIERAIGRNALSDDYAVSALMWIRLYDRKYSEAKRLATIMEEKFTRDTISRWVLGRVALVERRCDDATKWFSEIEAINKKKDLSDKKYPDVSYGLKMARLCSMVKKGEYEGAVSLHSNIAKWLDGEPKAVIEYQDEKNLIAFWKNENKKTGKQLAFFSKR